MTLAPIDLLASVVHLRPGGTIHAAPRAPVPAPDGGGRRPASCHARTDADVHAGRWQVHPEAEEIVSCLIGKIRLHLRPERPGRQEEVIRLGAGTAAIVPRGRRHRIGLDTPSTVLAVILPDGTRLEDPVRARDRTAAPKAGRR